MAILIGYGTRPEFVKLEPLIELLSKSSAVKTIRFLQHTDLVLSKADYSVRVPSYSNRLDSVIASIACIDEEVFKGISHVLVQGDTHSALTLALAAFHRSIPIIHLEAGLRTYDLDHPFPEEANRQLISRIASIHLCPTELNKSNLDQERVYGVKHVCGNTGLDPLVDIRNECEYTNKVYITLHRRENLSKINEWFSALESISLKLPNIEFIYPMHPNPLIRKHSDLFRNVRVVDPISPAEFKRMLSKSRFLISDSGGIQEEAVFLGKRCIIMRHTTERPEALEHGSVLCGEPEDLERVVMELATKYEVPKSNVFGDGRSSMRVAEILKNIL